jgi:hypothetical protein
LRLGVDSSSTWALAWPSGVSTTAARLQPFLRGPTWLQSLLNCNLRDWILLALFLKETEFPK